MPAGRPKPKQQEASEGFVYGPTDKSYSVSDIPKMKEQIANNPGLAGMLQPLIDRLEAGDFDKPWGPPDEDKKPPDTTPPDTTETGEYSYKGLTANDIMQYLVEAKDLTPEQLGNADVNQDGEITLGDAVWILQMAEGLRDPDTLEGINVDDKGVPLDLEGDDTTLPGATNQEDINAAIAAAMQEAGIGPDFNFSDVLTAADAEELFKNTLPIDYETLQKMGAEDWMPAGVQTAIDNALGNIQDQNYIDQATLDAQLAGLPDAAQIQQSLEDQGWGAPGDPFGGLSGITADQWDQLLGGNYATTNAVQQMIADGLEQGLSEDDILAMIKEQFGETMSDDMIMEAIAEAQANQYTSLMTEVQDLIANSLAEGMSEQEIMDLITAQYGDQMSPDDIMTAIATAQETQYTSLMDEVNTRIAEALTDGMTPEQIADMIKAEYGDQMSDDEILNAITTAQEGQYTSLMDAVNALIADSLAQGMSEADILALIQTEYGETMSDDDILNAIAAVQEEILTLEEIQNLIADSLAQGMSEQEIIDLITAQYGDQMTDDQILAAIAEAQEGVPTIQTIEAMINEALLEGMSPEDIAIMISDYVGDSGLLSADDIATMIADAIAGIETTPAEDALTADAVQQMIDTAMAQGMSTEQVQAMLAESGYMGEEGIQGLIGSALEGALGQGGSINEAIQNALFAVGDTTIDTTTATDIGTTPYGTYTSPYGDVDPYALMGTDQFAGTTPFSGGTITGAEDPTGLEGLDLGSPGEYDFDIPTDYQSSLYPSGIEEKYFEDPEDLVG